MQTNKPYLVLGQTIPETSKKYGVRVCTAGYDPLSNEFVRVYPLHVKYHFKRWNYYPELPLLKNPKDNRPESYKLGIAPKRLEDICYFEDKKKKRQRLTNIFNRHYADSLTQLNEERRSLALIRLNKPRGYFVNHSKKSQITTQLSMFDDTDYEGVTKDGYKYLPRVEFVDDAGKKHDWQLNSWDAFLHQKNLAEQYGYENLWDVLGLKDGSIALVGNMNHQRTTWLIITIFPEKLLPNFNLTLF